jgi:hypothetical protein
MSAKGYAPDDASDGPIPKVKVEQSKALARLVDLVQEQIAKNPYERDGKLWCKDAYALAPVLGVSKSTLRRRFKANATVFRLQTVLTDNRRTTLVRLVEEGEPAYSPTQQAKYLAKIWETRVGRPHTPKEFGMLYHFVRACPAYPGIAAFVFKLVLKDWGAFMAIVKSMPKFKYPDTPRYYQHPRLPIIRAFAQVAVEFWLQELQWQGELSSGGPEVGPHEMVDPKTLAKSMIALTAPLVACKIIKLEDEVGE